MENVERRRRRGRGKQVSTTARHETEEEAEVSSAQWEFINMTEQEEDLIYRMYRLVGDRWDLIAGRIPGRQPEEIERFWIMKNNEGFSEMRKQQGQKRSSRRNY